MRGVWWAAGLLVVVGLLVSACTGGDPEPATTSAAPVVESPTPSPSPTRNLKRLPERPKAMDEPTTDGAIAAATYVIDLFVYSHAAKDVGPWQSMTAETCDYCVGVVNDVGDLVTNHQSVVGGAIQVESSSAVEISEGLWFSVDMTVRQAPSQRVDRNGEVLVESAGGQYVVLLELSWDGGWQVDEMGISVDGER